MEIATIVASQDIRSGFVHYYEKEEEKEEERWKEKEANLDLEKEDLETWEAGVTKEEEK